MHRLVINLLTPYTCHTKPPRSLIMLFTFTANAITNPATGEATIPQPWPELLNTTTSDTTQPLPQPAISVPTPSPIQSSLATYLAPDPIAVFRSLNTPQILADNNGTIKCNNLMVWEYLYNQDTQDSQDKPNNPNPTLQSYIFALSNYIDSILTAYNSSLALRTEETHAFVRNVLLSCFGPSSLVLLSAITKPLHASLRNSSLSPRYSKFQSHNKLSNNPNNTNPNTSPHSYQSLPFPHQLIALIPTPDNTSTIPTIQDWPTLIHAFLSQPDLLFSGSPTHHMSCQDLLCFFPNGDSGDANFPHLGIRTRWTAAAHLSHAPILTLYPRIWDYVFGPLAGKNPALISAVWEQPTPQKPRKDKGVPRAERF